MSNLAAGGKADLDDEPKTTRHNGLPVISADQLEHWMELASEFLDHYGSLPGSETVAESIMLQALDLAEAVEPTGCFYVVANQGLTTEELVYSDNLDDDYQQAYEGLLKAAFPPPVRDQNAGPQPTEITGEMVRRLDRMAPFSRLEKAHQEWTLACREQMRRNTSQLEQTRRDQQPRLRIWHAPEPS